MQLLTAIVKLFLKRPTDTQELVQQVLSLATQVTHCKHKLVLLLMFYFTIYFLTNDIIMYFINKIKLIKKLNK